MADRLGVADAFDPGFGDIGGDDRVAFGAAETEQAEAGHQHDAGQGIELVLDAADALVVAREIVSIARGELARPLARDAGEVVELAVLRRRQDQRPVLGADGVVGRDDAQLAHAGPNLWR